MICTYIPMVPSKMLHWHLCQCGEHAFPLPIHTIRKGRSFWWSNSDENRIAIRYDLWSAAHVGEFAFPKILFHMWHKPIRHDTSCLSKLSKINIKISSEITQTAQKGEEILLVEFFNRHQPVNQLMADQTPSCGYHLPLLSCHFLVSRFSSLSISQDHHCLRWIIFFKISDDSI